MTTLPLSSPNEMSDNDLVLLTLKSPDHFLPLLKRYEIKLKRYIIRLSNVSPEEAEDILQEIFIKVYQNLNDFDSKLKFSSWIYRIAHNHIISSYRKRQTRPQTIEIDDNLLNELTAHSNLEKELDQKLLAQTVAQLLEKLKAEYREVLILKYLEEKSYEEISDIIKKPAGTVATLISKAKSQFKNEWQKTFIKNQ